MGSWGVVEAVGHVVRRGVLSMRQVGQRGGTRKGGTEPAGPGACARWNRVGMVGAAYAPVRARRSPVYSERIL